MDREEDTVDTAFIGKVMIIATSYSHVSIHINIFGLCID